MSEKPWQGLGYEDTKTLVSEMACGLERLIFGGRIVVGDPGDTCGYSEAYDFESFARARSVFEVWDGTGEPEGWVRHIPTYRRRPGGDPEKEYIAP